MNIELDPISKGGFDVIMIYPYFPLCTSLRIHLKGSYKKLTEKGESWHITDDIKDQPFGLDPVISEHTGPKMDILRKK